MEISNIEEQVAEFWEKNQIFKKSVEKPAGKKPKANYVFYDGPPFITGLPHYATLLPSIVKDAVPRYWTMKGYRVERVWGWDCHGLPAENQVEKELGLKNKKDIEKLGVDKFVNACRDYVNNVSGQWNWYVNKIARWVDMENAYKTMDLKFMESVIWAFKEMHNKGLIYEGVRSSLHCPRCATPLSKFEITMDAGSYKDITEMSIVVKFKLKNAEKITQGDFFALAWTTTPWTLPGNLALAVSKKIKYTLVEYNGEKFVAAKEKIKDIFKDKNYKIINEFSGEDLISCEYEPLFKNTSPEISQNKNSYKIYEADFVNTAEGTGIVHIAPNFGDDDFDLGKKNSLPLEELMDENGFYTEKSGEWAGMYFKDAGKEVIKKLNEKIFSKFNYTHSYPFCYRCSTPLIYKTQNAWYLDIDKIRKNMLKTNKKINWVPEYFKEGRFKYNIESAPHWCISRSRYWGSPIPVWRCESCQKIRVVGSIKEIEELSGKKIKDLHRPEIDKPEFSCNCSGIMKRVPEVLDCWFESGSMPFAQWHYPFERKNQFREIFPADFIIEYTGQLRGWFYYLHVLSNALFNSECFKNVVVTGVLTGTDGRKMSKSYGNYPDPKLTLEKYGGDALRMYFLGSPIITGGDMNMNEKDLQDSFRKNIMLFYNVYNFYSEIQKKFKNKKSENILDKWIISRVNELAREIKTNMEKYDIPSAVKPITLFIEDLSTWYLRLSRERLNNNDFSAINTLKETLETLSKLTAPFMPYISEYVWQEISENKFSKENSSVHLETWYNHNEKGIHRNIINKMNITREIVSRGLKERDQLKIALKWPLAKATVKIKKSELTKEYIEIIKSELNIKEIQFKENKNRKETEVKLDTRISPELESEGYSRELSRNVQAFRKKLGLKKEELIELYIFTEEDFKKIIEKNLEFIKKRTNSLKIELNPTGTQEKETFKNKADFSIKEKKGWIGIKKVNT